MIITDQSWKEINKEFPNVPMSFTHAIQLLRREISDISVELNTDSLYINHKGTSVGIWEFGDSDDYIDPATSWLIAMRIGSILKSGENKTA